MVSSFLEIRSEVSEPEGGLSAALVEIITARASGQSSCELHVEHPRGAQGVIGIARGQVIHARTSRSAGVPAFLEIARWRGAQVTEKPNVREERTIRMDLDELLAELGRHGRHEARTGLYEAIGAESTSASIGHSSTRSEATSTQEEAIPSLAREFTETEFEDEVEDAALEDRGFFDAALRASRTNVTALLTPDSRLSVSLAELSALKGFVAGAVIDAERGEAVAVERTSAEFDVSAAAQANAVLMRAGAFGALGAVEDVVVTLGDQYHLMRPIDSAPGLFFYLAMRREEANLALVRFSLREMSERAA